MVNRTPGEIVKTLILNDRDEVLVRYLEEDDVDRDFEFVNKMSYEDTYVMVSGEKIARDEVINYIDNSLIQSSQGKRIHLVAIKGEKMIGNAEVKVQEKRKSHSGVITIAIEKDFRGKGLGTQLMQTLIEEAKRAGLKLLVLSTMDVNLAGVAVYEKCGFVKVGTIPKAFLFRGEYVGETFYYLPI